MSDHLAISITIHTETMPKRHTPKPLHRILWNKIENDQINTLYTTPLKNKLKAIDIHKDIEKNQIEEVLEYITSCMHECSEGLKQSKFTKGLKPYWNDLLKEYNATKKRTYRIWCEKGRPRNSNIYRAYKESKRIFRLELRKARLQYEKEEMKCIKEAHSIDQRFFWYLINRSKKKAKGITPIQEKRKQYRNPKKLQKNGGNTYIIYTHLVISMMPTLGNK